jgi:hypothetical protein
MPGARTPSGKVVVGVTDPLRVLGIGLTYAPEPTGIAPVPAPDTGLGERGIAAFRALPGTRRGVPTSLEEDA